MNMLPFALAAAALSLAACDVVLTETDLEYTDRFDDYQALAADVAALPLTSAARMATIGSATYTGAAAIELDTAGPDSTLIGDATMFADFGGDSIRGRLDNFVGVVNGQTARDYNGALLVTGGDLGVGVLPSQFGANVDGTLFGSDVIDVNGSIIGNFRDEPVRNVAALSAFTSGGTAFTLNGAPVGGIMSIVADR